MKLIGSQLSPFLRKVRIVLAEKKIECALEEALPNTPGSRVPDYNPLGKIPALALDDGRARVGAHRRLDVSAAGRLQRTRP